MLLQWFSSAAAKRLTGRHFDLSAHLQAAVLRDRQRAQQRQAEEEKRQQSQLTTELTSSRLHQRREKDREQQRLILSEKEEKDRSAAASRRRHKAIRAAEQWAVDPSLLPSHSAAVRLSVPASSSPASSPSPPVPVSPAARARHGSALLPGPVVTEDAIAAVLRAVRRCDHNALQELLSVTPCPRSLLLANLSCSSSASAAAPATLLLLAISTRHLPSIALLLQHRADPNSCHPLTRVSPLHAACSLRLPKAIKLLMAAGADTELSSSDDRLCWEVEGGEDARRKVRTLVELLKAERESGVRGREREERRREEARVRQVWGRRWYDELGQAGRRKARDWVGRQQELREARDRRKAEVGRMLSRGGSACASMRPSPRAARPQDGEQAEEEKPGAEQRTEAAGDCFSSFLHQALDDEKAFVDRFLQHSGLSSGRRGDESALLRTPLPPSSPSAVRQSAARIALSLPEPELGCKQAADAASSRVCPPLLSCAASQPPALSSSSAAFFSTVLLMRPPAAAASHRAVTSPRTTHRKAHRPRTAPAAAALSAASVPASSSPLRPLLSITTTALRRSAQHSRRGQAVCV